MNYIVGAYDSRLSLVLEIAAQVTNAAFVVGDSFCHLRVGPKGQFDILAGVKRLKEAGMRTVLMTPVFATDPVLQETWQLITALVEDASLDAIIVHELGLLSLCNALRKKPYLIWDRYGFGRDFRINLPLLGELRSLGIDGVEVPNLEAAELCRESGLSPHLTVTGPQMATFGRRCYSRYLSKLPCSGGLCREMQDNLTLRDDVTGELLRPDGYRLLRMSSDAATPLPRPIPPWIAQMAWVSSYDHLSTLGWLADEENDPDLPR